MADIAPVSHHTPLYGPAGSRVDAPPQASTSPAPAGRVAGAPRPADRPGDRRPDRPSERPSDRVELSERARLLSQLAALPEVRTDLVEEIRAAIEAEEYDTPDRFEDALEAMIEEVLEGRE